MFSQTNRDDDDKYRDRKLQRNRAVVCVNRKMMEVCGEAENRLASELMHHELQIEKDVLDPLSQLAEVRELR